MRSGYRAKWYSRKRFRVQEFGERICRDIRPIMAIKRTGKWKIKWELEVYYKADIMVVYMNTGIPLWTPYTTIFWGEQKSGTSNLGKSTCYLEPYP